MGAVMRVIELNCRVAFGCQLPKRMEHHPRIMSQCVALRLCDFLRFPKERHVDIGAEMKSFSLVIMTAQAWNVGR